jgi:hypothetical protein
MGMRRMGWGVWGGMSAMAKTNIISWKRRRRRSRD